MKKDIDASHSHQAVCHINGSEKNYISDYNLNFLNRKYHQIVDNNPGSRHSQEFFIQKVYVSDPQPVITDVFKNNVSCFVCDFSMFMVDIFENNYVSLDNEGFISDEFFTFIASKGKAISKLYNIEDTEIIEIIAKQIVILLKNLKLVKYEDGRAKFCREFQEYNIYNNLFTAFWNNVSWSALFPSLPEAGEFLQNNRDLLKLILLEMKEAELLENIALRFLDQSGMNLRNEMLLVSYLDFSVFTWLNLFGIIKYVDYPGSDCVMIEMTETGRNILSAL